MGVTLLLAAVFILVARGVTAGLDYPLLLDKAVTALSGGRLFTFLYLKFKLRAVLKFDLFGDISNSLLSNR
jgi:hypothetical protein